MSKSANFGFISINVDISIPNDTHSDGNVRVIQNREYSGILIGQPSRLVMVHSMETKSILINPTDHSLTTLAKEKRSLTHYPIVHTDKRSWERLRTRSVYFSSEIAAVFTKKFVLTTQ